MRQAPESQRLCGIAPTSVHNPVHICGRPEFPIAGQWLELSTESRNEVGSPCQGSLFLLELQPFLFGGGLRVYLRRPWLASGYMEMLAVVLPRPGEASAEHRLAPFVTQWGADPAWADYTRYYAFDRKGQTVLNVYPETESNREYETLLARRTTHAGTPDELVEALLQIRNQVPVQVEFVARSHLPLLEYAAQVDVMQELAEGVAPHV